MKPSIIFRIQRFIHFLLQGIGKRETEHYLFNLPKPMTDIELYKILSWYGWQPNYMGYVYKGQVYQCRRLINGGKYQYHLRFYEDGKVTGHVEMSPEYDTSNHLSGVGLRTMSKPEIDRLKRDLEIEAIPNK